MSQQKHAISGTTAAAIAASIERGVQTRRLAAGESLPPIRELASSLKVSPATVAAAYRFVQARGLTSGQGRRGTRIRPPSSTLRQAAAFTDFSGETIDLATGNPDPDLLPPLESALRGVSASCRLYGEPLQLRALAAFAAAEFSADGVPSNSIAVLGGALDAIERILREHVRKGDKVAIEDPTLPGIIDVVGAMGYGAVPVALDTEGPRPEALEAALRRQVKAFILTPRAQNPTGAALTSKRVAELRRVLRRSPALLTIENDAAGPVAGEPMKHLADEARSHWAVVRSTSKFLGPDLRLAVVAGDELTIGRVQRRHAVGARWVSHVLQELALALWSDPASGRLLARASEIYAQRRRALIEALAARGINAHSRSGFNVWVPVEDEVSIVQALGQRGWAVAAGAPFRLASPRAVRVTASALQPDDARRFAADLAAIHRPVALASA